MEPYRKAKHRVIIEPSLCIGCGACAADCPASNIELEPAAAADSGRTASVFDPEDCLFCGH